MPSDQNSRDCRVFILAGGLGRRLAPLTSIIPKPLVPVGDRAILEILIRQIASFGFRDVFVSLGHLGHLIRAVIGDGREFGVNVTYTDEQEPLGTAGALGLLDPTDRRPVLVVNGDTLTDLDYGEVANLHLAHQCAATVVARRVEIRSDYGVLDVSPSGDLRGYQEKPTTTSLVSMGVNVLSGPALDLVRRPRRIDMPQLLLDLLAKGPLVRVIETDARWLDLGRMADVELANETFDPDTLSFRP